MNSTKMNAYNAWHRPISKRQRVNDILPIDNSNERACLRKLTAGWQTSQLDLLEYFDFTRATLHPVFMQNFKFSWISRISVTILAEFCFLYLGDPVCT